jgi:hypothetical protein
LASWRGGRVWLLGWFGRLAWLSDADAPASGNQLVTTTADWNAPAGSTLGDHQVSVYPDAVPLTPGKGAQPVTLPEISHGIGESLNGMHLFTWGAGGLVSRKRQETERLSCLHEKREQYRAPE